MEELEVLLLSVMGRGGHQQEIPRETRQQLADRYRFVYSTSPPKKVAEILPTWEKIVIRLERAPGNCELCIQTARKTLSNTEFPVVLIVCDALAVHRAQA
jgi:hypothetical protein